VPVQFDEREEETEPSQTGLRRPGENLTHRHREANVTAPLLDSTQQPDVSDLPIIHWSRCEFQRRPGLLACFLVGEFHKTADRPYAWVCTGRFKRSGEYVPRSEPIVTFLKY